MTKPLRLRRTLAAAAILVQAQATYFFAAIGVGLGHPKIILAALLIAQWVATVRLLNHVAEDPIRRGIAIWLVFSPLFLLPSAVAIWRLHIYGPAQAAPTVALTALLLGLYLVKAKRAVGATLVVVSVALFAAGVAYDVGPAIYASAISSAAAGIALSVRPLTHV